MPWSGGFWRRGVAHMGPLQRKNWGLRVPHRHLCPSPPGWGQPEHCHPAASRPHGLEQVGKCPEIQDLPFPSLSFSYKTEGMSEKASLATEA